MTKPLKNEQGRKSVRWRIRDLVDLEYFLHYEVHEGENAPSYAPTERDIYLTRLRHSMDETPPPRRLLIKAWLDGRRECEDKPLPGDVYVEIRRMAMIAAVVLGLTSGIGMALSLLGYTGTAPLNVSVYLGAAVFSQMLLLILLVMLFCLRAAGRSLVRNSVLAGLLGRFLAGALLRARAKTRENIDGPRREALAATAGLLQGRKQIYGSLFFWPAFMVMQSFALCFNLGLLGATLLRLSGTDVAFGWQSTFQVSSQAVFRIVETVALPWSWLFPGGIAHPSLAQIEGSRMILKEGIYHLSTSNLVSWWPFLCLSVVFYGILPRLLLLLSGIAVQSRLLARLRFDHGDCDIVANRMLSPVLQTAGSPSVTTAEQQMVTEGVVSAPREKRSGDMAARFVALVPDDIFEASEGLKTILEKGLGLQLTDRIKIGADPIQDKAVLDSLETAGKKAQHSGVLVLQEAWQPPIQEALLLFKQLRTRLGETGKIVVGLIGKPAAETIFTPVREEDWRIWRGKVDALGDPYLRAERLMTHDG